MRFINLDLVEDDLPQNDVYLCRDVIQHLSLEEGMAIIKNIEASGELFLARRDYLANVETGSKYLVTNFHVNKATAEAVENIDIPTGERVIHGA